jgi:hypothetical protein
MYIMKDNAAGSDVSWKELQQMLRQLASQMAETRRRVLDWSEKDKQRIAALDKRLAALDLLESEEQQ